MRWVCDRWKSAKGCYQSRNSPYEGVAHCTGRPAHPRLAVAALTGAEAERRFRLKAQHRAPVVAVLFRVPLAFLGGDNDPQRRALIDAGFGMRLHELDQGRPDAAVRNTNSLYSAALKAPPSQQEYSAAHEGRRSNVVLEFS